MKYTPRMLVAWDDVHNRIEVFEQAMIAEAVAIGSHAGKNLTKIIKQMRENL